MRVFLKTDIQDLNVSTLNKTIVNEQYLYTNEGIYKIKDNKIFNLVIKDNPIEEYTHDNINMVIDPSEFDEVECFRIPQTYLEKNIIKHMYTFNHITLVIELEDKEKTIYFNIKDKKYLNELATLLSIIK